jgi:hypothetical protein
MQDISINLSRPSFESKRRALLANGVNLPATGDRGHASAHGVVVEFVYEPGAHSGRIGILTLRLIDKPFLFPDTLVESHIREWFAS